MIQQIHKDLPSSKNLFFHLRILLFVFLGCFLVTTAQAQDQSSGSEKELTLSIMNRDIAIFRTTVALATPEQRIKRAQDRINGITEADLITKKIQVLPLELGGVKGMQFYLGEIPLFAMVEKDIDRESNDTLQCL
jgi:hypothetical protein